MHGLQSEARLECDIGGRLGQKTTVVETADKMLHRLQGCRREIRHFRLLHEMLLQRGLADEGVKKVLPLLGIFRGVGLSAAGAGHVVAPVFVELAQDLEFLVFGEIHFIALYF